MKSFSFFFFKNKKGQNTFWIVIGAVIAIVVLVILVSLAVKYFTAFDEGIEESQDVGTKIKHLFAPPSCEAKTGQSCAEIRNPANAEACTKYRCTFKAGRGGRPPVAAKCEGAICQGLEKTACEGAAADKCQWAE